METGDAGVGLDGTNGGRRDGGLGLAHVMPTEEELAVKIGGLDRVKVNDGDIPEATDDEGLEELATDAACGWKEKEGEGEVEGPGTQDVGEKENIGLAKWL